MEHVNVFAKYTLKKSIYSKKISRLYKNVFIIATHFKGT